MKQALFTIPFFFLFLGGTIYLYPKLNFLKEIKAGLMQDKPVACHECGALMWHGAQAHFCKASFEEAN